MIDWKRNKWKYILLLPVIAYFLIFCYKPMYGIIIAFKNYKPTRGIADSAWVGLTHFVSIVIICGLIKTFCLTDGNVIIGFFGGQAHNLLEDKSLFYTIFVATDIWQEIGWGSIIYLAAKNVMFKRGLTLFMMFTMYFGGGLIPVYLNMRDLGLVGSVWALVLGNALSLYNAIITKTAIEAIPESLSESIKYAAVIISTLPIMVVYPFLQKYFAKGVMVGAVKG